MEYTARWRKVNVVEPHKVVLFSTACMTCKVRRRVKVDDDHSEGMSKHKLHDRKVMRVFVILIHHSLENYHTFYVSMCEFLKLPNAVLNNNR